MIDLYIENPDQFYASLRKKGVPEDIIKTFNAMPFPNDYPGRTQSTPKNYFIDKDGVKHYET